MTDVPPELGPLEGDTLTTEGLAAVTSDTYLAALEIPFTTTRSQ
jgi:hypothetical protein